VAESVMSGEEEATSAKTGGGALSDEELSRLAHRK
jgi:hypothetical protein